jgi:Ala-tRNA(Pro) deacylase
MPGGPAAATMAPMSSVHITQRLALEHVDDYELIRHQHTESAGDEAAVLGTPPDEVGKTIVLVGEHGFVRAVIPASSRLDLHKVRPVIGCGAGVRLATEEELAGAYPMFELGAVPPFGGPSGDAAVLDRRLALRDTIVVEAGRHDRSIRLATKDLVRVAEAQIADICVPR